MSDSNMTSSDSDKSSEMTKLKNKKPVVKSSSSESFDEDDKQVSKVKKKRLRKSQNNSDSDSSHIEPSQFRSPKLNNYQILKTSPEKTKSSKSIKKSGASKSHDISSNSEGDSDVESMRRNKSPRKRKHEETSDESSSDSSKSSKSLQKIQKKQKEKPQGQGKSSQKLSRSTVLSSASDDEEEETSRSKSTKKSQASPSNKPSRDESDSTDLSDIHALAESNPEDLELWLIKVPAKVPLSSLPQQVLTDGIQDFSKHKKRYELISFPDEMIQRDHVSFVQGKSHQLLEGPCVKGQMQIVSKPSAPLRPVTAPLISHKPVPFPATLKVRFTPFGADAPASVNKSPKSRKHKKKKVSENEDTSVNGVEDVDASPRKKKKKKKKHSID